MLTLFPQLLDYQYFAPTFLRIGLAFVILAHGLPKLYATRALFAEWLRSMGFKHRLFWAWTVALAESVGGGLILFGFLTQLAAAVLIIEFLFIILWVRRGQPFIATAAAPGMSRELDFLILMGLLALLVSSSGAYAIDLPL
ncbi:MAG: DoxX family protein [bacterium]|nr:DoxX family protein [bacterium]